jgi:hypothetical protein
MTSPVILGLFLGFVVVKVIVAVRPGAIVESKSVPSSFPGGAPSSPHTSGSSGSSLEAAKELRETPHSLVPAIADATEIISTVISNSK